MENIIEHLKNSVNEAREVTFRVAFNDAKDKEGLPFTVSILVPSEYKDIFADYLENELYNTVANAEDWRGWPIEK